MQIASSRIWTRVALSISYHDNHYTTSDILWTGISKIQLAYWVFFGTPPPQIILGFYTLKL